MTRCLRGHDITVVGRSKQRMCRACLQAWDNERNQRRRSDPTPNAVGFTYSDRECNRRAIQRLDLSIARKTEQLGELGELALALFAMEEKRA